jgi:hypothetical protein
MSNLRSHNMHQQTGMYAQWRKLRRELKALGMFFFTQASFRNMNARPWI